MAKKNSKAKKKAVKRKSPAAKKQAVTKKAAQPKEAPEPDKEEPAEKPPEFGIIVYLRAPSKTWPKKIGSFLYVNEFKKWIYEGRPISLKEWNEQSDAIAQDLSQKYDYLFSPGGVLILPGIQIIELEPDHEEEETPQWKKNLDRAHDVQSEKVEEAPQEPEKVEEPEKPEEPEPDELIGTETGPPEETLY